ncbi:hypothetical protein ACFHYQ_23265 [Sphaerimonospora cavernae]|uniref:MoaD/ThiS family protein n=1 Tax=Sphaerimonospora cavernae TaxID=1740611 RepID=A0ABV6UAQ7_9ACTN
MTLTVGLRGYPEAVLAADVVTLDVNSGVTAGAVVQSLARTSSGLGEALIRPDGEPRQAAKVLVDGTLVSHETQIRTGSSVTVVAALPCDG